MTNKTVIITQRGEVIDSREDWMFSINVNHTPHKNTSDGFDIDITARKREIGDLSFDTKDEIIILSYNRKRGKLNFNPVLDKASLTLQHLLNAIANGENSWDAREHRL